jgi:hypothetical protein
MGKLHALRALVIGTALSSACKGPSPPVQSATTWPEADALFRSDGRWLGGDGACSVDLGGGRTLWMFGDTLLATTPARLRSESIMVHNSVAVQTGYDPSRALIKFYWGEGADGAPGSFVPESGGVEYWPEHGVRLPDGSLLLFYQDVVIDSSKFLDFHATSWTALRIDRPDDEPSAWTPAHMRQPSSDHGVVLGWGVLLDDDRLYAYGTRTDMHDTFVARWNVADASAGDLSAPEWWTDRGWIADGPDVAPAAVIGPAQPEFSVHFDSRLGLYAYVASEGFLSTTLAMRTAPRPEGPWTEPMTFLRPPESFAGETEFVYAGKAHPELLGADLVATYVPSVDGSTSSSDPALYVPHFVRITYR